MTLYRLRTVVLDCSGKIAVVLKTCDLRALTIDQAKAEADRRSCQARTRTMRDKHEQLDHLRALVSHLSPRERQVFERVVRGKMNKEVARELGATGRTIKAHRHHVMEKLKAGSLAELVMIAERLGVIAGEDRPI